MPASRLPPLNALRAFEAVGRLGSLRAAAQELGVGASAISRHVANLEGWLGAALLEREGRGLRLTERGREYLQGVEPALAALARASARAMERRPRRRLSVSAPPSLTANWLLPRLEGFIAAHPGIELRLVDRMTHPESAGEVDAAIEYRLEPSPRLLSRRLMEDELVPMAAPAYVARHQIRGPADLGRCTLIETERRLLSWAEALGPLMPPEPPRRLVVGLSLHALEAARLGLGVALANRMNAERAVAEGALVVPFALERAGLPPRPRYWFSVLRGRGEDGALAAFRDWLFSEAGAGAGAGAGTGAGAGAEG